MAFKIVIVSVTFMLFVMPNLAVYCTAEETKTREQQWYHKNVVPRSTMNTYGETEN